MSTARFFFLDFEAEKASSGIHLYSDAAIVHDCNALGDVMMPMSDCGLVSASVAMDGDIDPSEPVSTGPTPNAEDKVVFEFVSEANTTILVSVPGPVATIFTADKETVDPLDSLVAAFIVQMLALAADKAGNAIVALLRGWRARRS